MLCPNTCMKFREPYHLNHVIPRLDSCLLWTLNNNTTTYDFHSKQAVRQIKIQKK